MAFKSVADLSADNAIQLGGVNRKTNKANPTSITGYFLGSREVDSTKSTTGKAKLHIFQTSTGNVGVWGKTDLDRKLGGATIGCNTRITYQGMQETKNNPMYKYKVEQDADDTIDVTAETTLESSDSSDAYEEPISTSYADAEDDVDVEPVRPAPKAPPSASQARVQALLNSRKSS